MNRSDELRSLAGQAAQARADVEHLIERARERAFEDAERARRASSSAKAQALQRIRDAFRRELETLRDDLHALTRTTGPALAPWRDEGWKKLDPDPPRVDAAQSTAVRIGDLALFPTEAGDDLLVLPATVTLDEDEVVLVDAAQADMEPVRSALLGWCVRVVATLGRGRVSVVWFDSDGERSAVPVPHRWRPEAGGPSLDDYVTHLRRRVPLAPAAPRSHDADEPLLIVVAIGVDADRSPHLRKLMDEGSGRRRPLGTHLLVAPSTSIASSDEGVLRLAVEEGGSRFTVADDDLAKHEVVLQDAPPAELVERLSRWTEPPPRVEAARQLPTEQRDEDPTVEAEAATELPADPAGRAGEPDPSTAGAAEPSSHAGSRVADLLGLIHGAPRSSPSITLGSGDDGTAVTTPLDRTIFVHGGSPRSAADRFAGFLVEIACQTSVDDTEFAVLDLSEDSAVADRFDPIVDLLPHLVDVADGVGGILALQEAVAELESGPAARPARCLLAVAPDPLSDRVASLLERVASERPRSGVMLCLWTPSEDGAPARDLSRSTIVTLADDRGTVRTGTAPSLTVQLASPLSGADIAVIAEALRGARA